MKPTRSILAIFLACGSLFAQTSTSTSVPGAGQNYSLIAVGTPSLSKIEQLQLENLQLKSALIQQQFLQIQSQLSAFSDSLSAEYTGRRFDLRSQSFVKTAPHVSSTHPEVRK